MKSLVPVLANRGALAGTTIARFGVWGSGACAVDTGGSIGCWGTGTRWRGELFASPVGLGATSTTAVSMSTGSLSGKKVAQISVGGSASCALAQDNSVHCWGTNVLGELGPGSTTPWDVLSPRQVDLSALKGAGIKKISNGSNSSCLLTTAQAIWCWGWLGAPWEPTGNTWKDLGTTLTRIPTGSLTNITDVVDTTVGVCFVASARAYCLGSDYHGMLGVGGKVVGYSGPGALWAITNTPSAVKGVVEGQDVASIRVGNGAFAGACALLTDGRAACWGHSAHYGADLTSTLDVSDTAPRLFIPARDGSTVCPDARELTSTTCSLVASRTYYYRVSYVLPGVTGWTSPTATAARP